MTNTIKPGDRVRLTASNRMPGFASGDRRTIVGGPIIRAVRQPYYLVTMNIGDVMTTTILDATEIELEE